MTDTDTDPPETSFLEVSDVVERAVAAAPRWRMLDPVTRAGILRAVADRLDGADDELVLPARLIDRHIALQQNFLAVREQAALRRCGAAKEHAAQLRRRILEREINVAGALCAEVGDLAADPDGAD